ncbi:MAG: phage major capsid protein, partial [Devosia sp.]
MTEATSGLEHKAGTGSAGDTEALVSELMGAFEEFKRSNEQRLGEIEKRGSADALTEEKITRLNQALDGAKAAIDRANVERARPRLEGGHAGDRDEYKDAFAAYVKRGEEKALSIGS